MYSEKIIALKIIFKEDKDIIDMIKEILDGFSDYVNRVVGMENAISTAKFRMEVDEYREYIQKLDIARRVCHNSCISGMKFLNRICLANNLELFFNGDIEDRYAVADAIGESVNEIFKNRKR